MGAVVAEFIGTFFLVFVGTGAVMANALTHSLSNLEIVLAFAGAIGIGVYAAGHVSGGHLNPAVTIGLWSARVFPSRMVVPYLVAQVAGATVASLILRAALGMVGGLGVTQPASPHLVGASFLVEFLGTFLLVYTVYGVAVDRRAAAGIQGFAIGGAIALAGLFAGPISGGSVNPARSLGPAIVSGNFHDIWIYIVAPILGGIAAALVYRYVVGGPASIEAGTSTRT
jgi:MIP family channel proteins